ncbi:hypothetical protein U91I_01178 [alpha proteobacterium U9-1i]|nr:hypothetical protein U91I_01178 [alpha proteobacterium U9-1i]
MTAGAEAARAAPERVMIEAVSGYRVSLVDMAVVGAGESTELRGWARRTPGRPGLILAHLRVEAFDATGERISVTEARWNGALAMRDSAAARFYVPLPDAAIARVRVSVEPGAAPSR